MKIGIVSDSHGNAKRLDTAVELLIGRDVEAIVHCGDIGSARCVEILGGGGVPTYMVPGNMDRHVGGLVSASKKWGVNFSWQVAKVPIGDGKYLVATHGDDERLLNELIVGGQFPYICRGHTHYASDERIGSVRIINPGALRHPRRPRRPTAAILDTAADTLEHINVPK